MFILVYDVYLFVLITQENIFEPGIIEIMCIFLLIKNILIRATVESYLLKGLMMHLPYE